MPKRIFIVSAVLCELESWRNAGAMALVARYNMREVFGCARMMFGPIPKLPHVEIFGLPRLNWHKEDRGRAVASW